MKIRGILILAICVSVLWFTPCTSQAGELLLESFDGYPTGSPPVPPWSEFYAGPGSTPVYTRAEAAALGVTIQIDDTVYYGSSGKSCHFLDTSNSVWSMISRSFSPASSVVLEYVMRTHNDAYEGTFVQLQGDGGHDYQAAFSNGSYASWAGWIGIHNSPEGWVKPDLLPYVEDVWYYVRRELDCSTDTGSYYVEELLGELGDPGNNSAFYSLGRSPHNPNTYVDEIWMHTSGSQGADCYVDEINVTPEPVTLSLLALGGLAMLRKRRRGLRDYVVDMKYCNAQRCRNGTLACFIGSQVVEQASLPAENVSVASGLCGGKAPPADGDSTTERSL